jgi:nitrate reductase NapAB chaperone NapD
MERSSHVISRLVEEKREVLRKLEELESQQRMLLEEIEETKKLIASIDAVLLHFDEDHETEEIKAKRRYKKRFPNGELKKRIIKVLKEAKGKPLSTRSIAELVYEKHDVSNEESKNTGRSLRGYTEVVDIAEESDDALWVLERYAAAATEKDKEGSPTLTLLRQRQ